MSLGSSSPRRREEAIEAARRRLRRLEIETHRIKADLARLEAEVEDDIADRLSRRFRRRLTRAAWEPVAEKNGEPAAANEDSKGPAVISFEPGAAGSDSGASTEHQHVADGASRRRKHVAAPNNVTTNGAATAAPEPPVYVDALTTGAGSVVRSRKRARRAATSPIALSFAVHAAVVLFFGTLTFATLTNRNIFLMASPAAADETAPPEISEVEITAHKFDDAELQNTVVESDEFNITDNMAHELEAAKIGAGSLALGEMGQLNVLPGEVGTLMAGAGSPSSGKPGGDLGTAVFFGARSKGDRFVFVVDNSSSMKGGRLELALAELVKTVDALTARQMFYVIFVSDQTYPMFYPAAAPGMLPATPQNKKRLAEWLPKAILASGNNRKLIEAMDMAAALQPQVVYLLWDGDLRYSDKVRQDVMTHLTQPNHWQFSIHTLGMGITSLDAQQNLTMIALAHGGTYQRIDVPAARGR
jgi:hypothetical protein